MKTITTLAVLIAATCIFTTAALAKPQTHCPVMGGKINTELYADHNGKRVYFCCAGCIEPFKKNPEKFIKKLEDAGYEPAKTPAAKK